MTQHVHRVAQLCLLPVAAVRGVRSPLAPDRVGPAGGRACCDVACMNRPLYRSTTRPHACSSAGLRRVAAGRGGGGVSAGGLRRAICPHVRYPQRRELPALPVRVARCAAAAHLPCRPHQSRDDHVRVHRGAGDSRARPLWRYRLPVDLNHHPPLKIQRRLAVQH